MGLTKQELERLKLGIAKGRILASKGAPEIDELELESDKIVREGIREGYTQHLKEVFRDCLNDYRVATLKYNLIGDAASFSHLKNTLRWVSYIRDVIDSRKITDAQDFKLRKESDDQYAVEDLQGNRKYTITKSKSGKWSCTCTGFMYRHKCKHVEALLQLLSSDTTDRLPQHLARVRQLEKSLQVWEERLAADPNNKTAQKNVEERKAALEKAKEIAAEIEARPKPQRHPRSEFLDVVPSLDKLFEGLGKYEIVGSWRRGKDTYKDVDILTVMSPKEWRVLKDRLQEDDNFGPAPGHTHAEYGDDVIRGGYVNGPRVDYLDINRVPNPDEWGAWLLFRTGSAQFNIAMRGWLKKFGCGLNERGLLDPDGNVVASKTEEDIFKAIGIPFINPKDREDSRKFYQEVRLIQQPAFLKSKVGDSTEHWVVWTKKEKDGYFVTTQDPDGYAHLGAHLSGPFTTKSEADAFAKNHRSPLED